MRLIFNTSDQPAPQAASAPIMPHEAACMCDDCLEILTRPDTEGVLSAQTSRADSDVVRCFRCGHPESEHSILDGCITCHHPNCVDPKPQHRSGGNFPCTQYEGSDHKLFGKVLVTPQEALEVPAERPADHSISEQKGEAGATPASAEGYVGHLPDSEHLTSGEGMPLSAWDRENAFVRTSSDRDELRELLRGMRSPTAYNWWDGTSYESHVNHTVLINKNGGRITVGIVYPKLVSEIAVESGKLDELLKRYNIPSGSPDNGEVDDDNWANEGGYSLRVYQDEGGEG
jgi:hypothetical protein